MMRLVIIFLAIQALHVFKNDVRAQSDIFEFHLYEKNSYKKVTKKNIDGLIPLTQIDLSPFKDVQSLDVIKSCNYCEVEELIVGSFIEDFSLLLDPNYLQKLEILDLSGAYFSRPTFDEIYLGKLEKLNISGLKMDLDNIKTSFPNLKEIVIRNNQYTFEEQKKIEEQGVRISYDELSPLKYQFNKFELMKFKDRLFLQRQSKPVRYVILINPNGEVVEVKPENNGSTYEVNAKELQRNLFFEDIKTDTTNMQNIRTVILPVSMKN